MFCVFVELLLQTRAVFIGFDGLDGVSLRETESSGHSGVFVRSPKLSVLERALNAQKASVSKTEGGLLVSGLKTDQIGKLAFESNVPVYELTERSASLEEAFLELTAGSEEFVGKKERTS